GGALAAVAVAEWRALVARDPSNLRMQRGLATALAYLGDRHIFMANDDAATAAYQEVAAITARAFSVDPSDDDALGALALAYEKLGDIARDGDRMDEAMPRYRSAAALRALRASKEPGDLRRWRQLAISCERIKSGLLYVGKPAEALPWI